MQPSQALRVRSIITGGLQRSLTRALTPFLGRALTLLLVGQMRDASLPLVLSARGALLSLANQQYRDFLAGKPPLTPPVLDKFGADSWQGSFLKVTGLEDPVPPDHFTPDHLATMVRKGDHWARDAERGALIDYTLRDNRIDRWARIDPQPPSCPFCTLLISRGAVYKTKHSAGVGDMAKFHTGCTCTAVLVAKGQKDSFPGVEFRNTALDLYNKAVKQAGPQAGLSGILKAMKNGPSPEPSNQVPGRMAKDSVHVAIQDQTAKLDLAKARKRTLENMNPSSASAKDYKTTQLKAQETLIQELNAQLKTLKG